MMDATADRPVRYLYNHHLSVSLFFFFFYSTTTFYFVYYTGSQTIAAAHRRLISNDFTRPYRRVGSVFPSVEPRRASSSRYFFSYLSTKRLRTLSHLLYATATENWKYKQPQQNKVEEGNLKCQCGKHLCHHHDICVVVFFFSRRI